MESSIEFEFNNPTVLSKDIFDRICRTCLSPSETALISEISYGGKKLGDILNSLFSIQVEEDDGLPKNICLPCTHLLTQLYTFKQQVCGSQILLRTLLTEDSNKKDDDLNLDLSVEEVVTPFETEKAEVITVQKENELNVDPCLDVVTVPKYVNRLEEVAVKSKDEVPKLYCKTCNKLYDSILGLKLHRCTINGDEKIPSLDVGKSVKSQSKVGTLMDSYSKDLIKCLDPEIRKGTTVKRKTQKVHVNQKRRPRLNYCKPCKKQFDSISALQLHKKQVKHSRPRTHACLECGKAFSYSHLIQHMRTHTKEKPYCCHICGQRFSLNSNLYRHICSHTGEKRYECDICDKDFSRREVLEEHKRTLHTGETPFMCSYCGLRFSRYLNFKTHLRTHPLKGDETTVAEEGVFKCSVCDRTYPTKDLLNQHMITHGVKTFMCSECGKCFTSKVALIIHNRVHTGDTLYTCDICSKTFMNLLSLKCHVVKHTGEKPSNSRHHTKIHSPKKPHSCSYCGMSFTLKETLMIHEGMHTDEKQFMCDICHKRFYDRSCLKKHKAVHIKSENL